MLGPPERVGRAVICSGARELGRRKGSTQANSRAGLWASDWILHFAEASRPRPMSVEMFPIRCLSD